MEFERLFLQYSYRMHWIHYMFLKKAGVVRKILSRYLSTPLSNGFMKMCVRENEGKYFNNIIELKNFSNNVCLFRL